MSTIREIRKFENWLPDPAGYRQYDGFAVRTDEETIIFGISNSQSCCEHWGYLVNEQNLGRFYGAELLGVRKTDTDRQVAEIEYTREKGEWSLDAGEVVFLDVLTSEGIVQFAAYNAHNGYYGHEVGIWIHKDPPEMFSV